MHRLYVNQNNCYNCTMTENEMSRPVDMDYAALHSALLKVPLSASSLCTYIKTSRVQACSIAYFLAPTLIAPFPLNLRFTLPVLNARDGPR